MVATCHILLCNHIHHSETCSGSAHPVYTFVCILHVLHVRITHSCGPRFSPYVCVSVCMFGAISTLSTQVKRNNYMFVCLFSPIWGGEPQFFSEPHFSFECHVHFDKRSFSRFYISLPKGTAGYLWLQAIRTLSKPVFINYCFNSWLISAAEILGRPLSEEQFNH